MQRLGQHFLKNRAVLEKIMALVDPRPGETIIEIGPGRGELTEELASSFELLAFSKDAPRLIAIERDEKFVEILKNKFAADTRIEVIHGDALKLLPTTPKSYQLTANSYAIVGNIPYYITGHLLRVIGELEAKPRRCVFTIQKEVAQRLVASPPRMNRLAASVQFWADVKIALAVPREDFSPPPKVDSAAIVLETHTPDATAKETREYHQLAHAIFQQPRKTIFNNLRAEFSEIESETLVNSLTKLGIPAQARPQDLSVLEIVSLASLLHKE
jgi:16S rRNA (adenine1518-N6/adenine1519-N6)-dimethyltransferase